MTDFLDMFEFGSEHPETGSGGDKHAKGGIPSPIVAMKSRKHGLNRLESTQPTDWSENPNRWSDDHKTIRSRSRSRSLSKKSLLESKTRPEEAKNPKKGKMGRVVSQFKLSPMEPTDGHCYQFRGSGGGGMFGKHKKELKKAKNGVRPLKDHLAKIRISRHFECVESDLRDSKDTNEATEPNNHLDYPENCLEIELKNFQKKLKNLLKKLKSEDKMHQKRYKALKETLFDTRRRLEATEIELEHQKFILEENQKKRKKSPKSAHKPHHHTHLEHQIANLRQLNQEQKEMITYYEKYVSDQESKSASNLAEKRLKEAERRSKQASLKELCGQLKRRNEFLRKEVKEAEKRVEGLQNEVLIFKESRKRIKEECEEFRQLFTIKNSKIEHLEAEAKKWKNRCSRLQKRAEYGSFVCNGGGCEARDEENSPNRTVIDFESEGLILKYEQFIGSLEDSGANCASVRAPHTPRTTKRSVEVVEFENLRKKVNRQTALIEAYKKDIRELSKSNRKLRDNNQHLRHQISGWNDQKSKKSKIEIFQKFEEKSPKNDEDRVEGGRVRPDGGGKPLEMEYGSRERRLDDEHERIIKQLKKNFSDLEKCYRYDKRHIMAREREQGGAVQPEKPKNPKKAKIAEIEKNPKKRQRAQKRASREQGHLPESRYDRNEADLEPRNLENGFERRDDFSTISKKNRPKKGSEGPEVSPMPMTRSKTSKNGSDDRFEGFDAGVARNMGRVIRKFDRKMERLRESLRRSNAYDFD